MPTLSAAYLTAATGWTSPPSPGRNPGTFVQRVIGPVLLLLLLLLLAVQWRTVDAERVVHHRGDQRMEENPRRNHRQAMNYTEALHYLQKYGYLEHCRSFPSSSSSSSRDRRFAVPVPAPSSSSAAAMTPEVAEERAPDCSEQTIADAFRSLQQSFHLAPTGRLDDATRSLMGRGRCGNSDDTPAAAAPAVDDDEDEGSRRRKRRRRRRRRRRSGNAPSPWQWRLPSSDRWKRRDNDFIDEGDPYSDGFGADHHHHDHDHDQPRSSKRRRREQLLEEISDRIRRRGSHGNDDDGGGVDVTSLLRHRFLRRRRRRSQRSISIAKVYEGPGGVKVKFQKDENSPVRWRLLGDGVSGKIPLTEQRAILELSFRMWSEVIPLKFVEANDVNIVDVDVIIAFAKQTHGTCSKPFDGRGGELAHSWTAGDIHFDEDEDYRRVDPSVSGSSIDLLKVAVHEVGHVLGLVHNLQQNQSIMYPIYVARPSDLDDDFELSLVDRRDVQKIYGVCKGPFDVVFDWLRRVPSAAAAAAASTATDQEPVQRSRYIFNTYFFRNNRYWMYENRFNRTRFGDPLYIGRGWTGIPDQVNAYAQVISASGHEYDIDTYFFVGDSYYKYDDQTDRVEDGYPRRISEDFGAKSSDNESIPNDLDAVLFDNRDSLLYFFKGEWVWTYDPRQIGRNGCCEGKVRFSELFPVDQSNSTAAADDDDAEEALAGDLDTVFYSYHFHTIFFFKGESVYENAAYHEKTPSVNRLRKLGTWYQTWFDICDVE